ncbi:MAG: fumarylacetoacetate hydrolase family protein [Bacteroidales bacterium]
MKIYKTTKGILIEKENTYVLLKSGWDDLINRDDLFKYSLDKANRNSPIDKVEDILKKELLPPIGKQEVWAAGVTYLRSREARMEEAQNAGGGDFYDRVYHAARPEIFFKSNPYRTVGSGDHVRIRKDSGWNVPEPELTLLISSNAKIIGYTVGNDMSSRDIEGENPLYLPQAKTYDKSAAIGPCVYVPESTFPPDSKILMEIIRTDKKIFSDEVAISQMKRKFMELVEFLFRETSFPHGCFLMTGTGIVPPDEFSLKTGDEIRITIDHIGTLVNYVE